MKLTIKNWLFDIILIIFVASPTSTLFYALMFAATFLCLLLNRKERSNYRKQIPNLSFKAWLFVLILFFSCFLYVFSGEPFGSSALRALTYGMLFIGFPIVGKIKIHNLTIYSLIVYLFLSQLCYVLSISPLITYFSTFYPMDADSGMYSQDYLTTYGSAAANFMVRLGGYLYNPNSCSRMYHMLLLLLIAFTDISSKFEKILLIAFSGLALIGIMMTGSRTGLAIFALLVLYYLYQNNHVGGKIIAGLSLVVFLYVVLFMFKTESTGDTVRALQLGNGLNDSFSGKINHLVTYLSGDNSIFNLLFGRFNQHTMELYIDATSLDSEYGIAIFTYGFLGLFVMVSFMWSILIKIKGTYKLVYLLFLWMLSSSLVFSYRTSMLFFFVVSVYLSKSLNSISNGKRNNYQICKA